MVADRAAQQRHWFVCDDPQGIAWQYPELLCCYFDDLNLIKGYEQWVSQGYLSQAEVDAVSKFHQEFDRYSPPEGDEYDHEAISRDPAWLDLCATAREAWEALRLLLNDPEEIKEIGEIIEQDESTVSLRSRAER